MATKAVVHKLFTDFVAAYNGHKRALAFWAQCKEKDPKDKGCDIIKPEIKRQEVILQKVAAKARELGLSLEQVIESNKATTQTLTPAQRAIHANAQANWKANPPTAAEKAALAAEVNAMIRTGTGGGSRSRSRSSRRKQRKTRRHH